MESLKLNEQYGIKSITPFFGEKESKGLVEITRYSVSDRECMMYNLRADPMMQMISGDYTRLKVGSELMMSDTLMERRTNGDFIIKANGRVLIACLGLGLIIHNIIDKDIVKEIIVIEKYQDVIDLVAPKFNHPKLKIICADIFEWKPERSEKFDTIYFDIWPTISTENLPQMAILSNRFKSYLNRKNEQRFMDSWLKKHLQNRKRRENREESRWW